MSDAMIDAAGWTMLHFLWQGALIGAIFGIVLMVAQKRPQLRYLAGCFALLTMLGAVVSTGALQYNDLSTEEPVAETSVTETPLIEHTSLVFTQCRPCHIMPSAEAGDNLVASWNPEVACLAGSTAAIPLDSSGQIKAESPSVEFKEAGSEAKESQSRSSLFLWLVGIWVLGMTLLSLRFIISWGVAQRLRNRMTVTPPLVLKQCLKRVANQVGVDRPVRLLISAAVTVPSVIGWLRPVILLPVASVAGLTQSQLEAVLAHELAHVRRHDYLVNLLQHVVEIILFFHPVVWWVSKKVRDDREFCCDDIAARAAGNTIDYARALATLEEQRGRQVTLEVAANGGSLQARIRRLCGVERPRPLLTAAFPTVLLFLAAVVPFAMVHSQEPNKSKAVEAKFKGRALTSEDAKQGFRHLLKKAPEPNIMFSDFVMLARALDQTTIVSLLDEVGLKRRDGYWAWTRSALYAELASRDLDSALDLYRRNYGGFSGVREHVPHAIYVGSRPKDPWAALAYLRSIPDDPRFVLTRKKSGINAPMVYSNADWFEESHRRLFKKLAAIDPERAWRELPGRGDGTEGPVDHNQLAQTYYPYLGMVDGFFSGLKDYEAFEGYFKRFELTKEPHHEMIAIPVVKAWMNHDISAGLAWAPPERKPGQGCFLIGGVDGNAIIVWARENPKAALEVIRKDILPKWRLSLASALLQGDPSFASELIAVMGKFEWPPGTFPNDEALPKIWYALRGAMASNAELQKWDSYPEEGRTNRPLDYQVRYDFFKAAIANKIFSEEEQTKLREYLDTLFGEILNPTNSKPAE